MAELLHVEYNALSRADGSAVYCDDRTVLMVAVYGPTDVSSSREDYERAAVNCIFKERTSTNKADPKWKFVENFVCSTLESSIYGHLYPRTLINIIIQELQCRNNLVAPALNASVCALMNAGISLKYLVAAVCIGVQVDGKSEKLILNPNLDELSECTANLVVVLDNKDYKLISFLHEGSLSIDQFDRAMGLAKGACQDVFKFYKESVKKQFTEVSQVDDQTGDQLDSQPDDQSSDQPDEVVLD